MHAHVVVLVSDVALPPESVDSYDLRFRENGEAAMETRDVLQGMADNLVAMVSKRAAELLELGGGVVSISVSARMLGGERPKGPT
jgi:hypothetical protein